MGATISESQVAHNVRKVTRLREGVFMPACILSVSKNLINKTHLTYSLSYKSFQRVKFKLQRIIIIIIP